MEVLSQFEAWWAPVVIVFGILASLDKAFDLYKKYKGLAQAPDKKQDGEIADLRKEVNILCAQLAQYRYDPKAYEARVRERMSWGEKDHEDDDE